MEILTRELAEELAGRPGCGDIYRILRAIEDYLREPTWQNAERLADKLANAALGFAAFSGRLSVYVHQKEE